MSFRWFVYYCSLCGGCAAYIGWIFGRLPQIENHVLRAAIQGMFLGLILAIGLTLVDTLWTYSARDGMTIPWRIFAAGFVGGIGGFVGGMVGQILLSATQLSILLVLGWTITGFLIGAAPGAYELLVQLAFDDESSGAMRKVRNGVIGGLGGGLLGGLLFLLMAAIWSGILGGRSEDYWSPSAWGFVVLGLCIGLMIGLAQVILKEAWIRVVKGFRAGRELILSRNEITIGRGEGCDVALFGDMGVDKLHARIVQRKGRYFLEDMKSAEGTYVNGELVEDATPLQAGDEIEVGRSMLLFGERRKRTD